MQNRSRRMLMALVGAYLVYTGGKLIMDVMNSNPSYKVLLIIAGAFFVIFGAATVFFNIKEYIAEGKQETEAGEEADDGTQDAEEFLVEEDVEEGKTPQLEIVGEEKLQEEQTKEEETEDAQVEEADKDSKESEEKE